MTTGAITKGDVSLLAREIHCVLKAAESLGGDPKQVCVFGAAERLADSLTIMTVGLELGQTHEEAIMSQISGESES